MTGSILFVMSTSTSKDSPMRRSTALLSALTVLTSALVLPASVAEAQSFNRAELFGASWYDVDGNGCDTRNDILNRDMYAIELLSPGKSECKEKTVLAGYLEDPYSGLTLSFLRGTGSGQDGGVQIDHMIPLKTAYDRGASSWTFEERRAFANDPDNLMAVRNQENSSKRDSFLDKWMPSNETYHCEYSDKYLGVLTKYSLPIFPEEQAARDEACARDTVPVVIASLEESRNILEAEGETVEEVPSSSGESPSADPGDYANLEDRLFQWLEEHPVVFFALAISLGLLGVWTKVQKTRKRSRPATRK